MESPETKNVIISSHGMLPILEILETLRNREIILSLLKIVNIVSLLDTWVHVISLTDD